MSVTCRKTDKKNYAGLTISNFTKTTGPINLAHWAHSRRLQRELNNFSDILYGHTQIHVNLDLVSFHVTEKKLHIHLLVCWRVLKKIYKQGNNNTYRVDTEK